MKQFVGKDVREIMIVDGRPYNVFDLPDGRRAFQWYWGGGTVAMPASSWSNTTGYVAPGGMINATTTTTHVGGGVYSSPGCLITYIAVQKAGSWTVEEIRYPDRLVC